MRTSILLYFLGSRAQISDRAPDNCLLAQLGESNVSADLTYGSIKFDHLTNPTFDGRCAIEVYAPKKCELGFKVRMCHLWAILI